MMPKAIRTLWVLLFIATLSQLARGEAVDNEQALEAELIDLKKTCNRLSQINRAFGPINKCKIAPFGRWMKKLLGL